MTRTYVSIGSNINRRENVLGALDVLTTRFKSVDRSPVYESDAIGFSGPPFYNLVGGFDTDFGVAGLIDVLKSIESDFGRKRGPDPFEDRTLDLDVVLFGNYVSSDTAVDVPSSDILRYAFVLRPLAEIAPTVMHPVEGVSIATLWNQFDGDAQSLERVELNPD